MTAWLGLLNWACRLKPLEVRPGEFRLHVFHPLVFRHAASHVARIDGLTCLHADATPQASVTARHCHVHRAASRHWFCKWPDSLAALKIQPAAFLANA